MSGKKYALVTGATGFVGAQLCKELLNHGYKVRAMYRSDDKLKSLEGLDLDLVKADICNKDQLLEACENVDVVFHIAALFRQAKHPDEVYHAVNVQGTANVFEAAIEKGVQRLIHCSTVGVHSHIPKPPADENEAYRPGDIYQETKCEGEKVALSYLKAGRIKGVIIRPAMIWGPGDTRTLKLFKGIKNGKLPLIGNGNTLVHWILVSDLARAFRLAAEQKQLNDQIFIIAGRESVSMKTLFTTIAKHLGVSNRFLRIPAWPIQVIGSLVEICCIPFGIEPPIYRRRVDFFTKTRCFSPEKAKKLLGFEAENDFEQEVALIAGWYQEQGWV